MWTCFIPPRIILFIYLLFGSFVSLDWRLCAITLLPLAALCFWLQITRLPLVKYAKQNRNTVCFDYKAVRLLPKQAALSLRLLPPTGHLSIILIMAKNPKAIHSFVLPQGLIGMFYIPFFFLFFLLALQ